MYKRQDDTMGREFVPSTTIDTGNVIGGTSTPQISATTIAQSPATTATPATTVVTTPPTSAAPSTTAAQR